MDARRGGNLPRMAEVGWFLATVGALVLSGGLAMGHAAFVVMGVMAVVCAACLIVGWDERIGGNATP